ncbi:uncharacterized protein LOC128200049 [Galleria mellonella]|uniref:Uncharacterized protein LOC128200049 n=1 Tax=Galleria mellonella TaxID=7137 RepID=A0ABM3M980_GALME|nr:uncharacterized protein LOC128200049 [Galleria mellonella]
MVKEERTKARAVFDASGKGSNVTFGTSCAPYLAVKSLQQVACDEGHNFPLAAERVKSDFYMDDIMTGCYSEEEVVEVCRQLKELLKRGGFELQKWMSNQMHLLKCLDLERNNEESNDKEKANNLEIKSDDITKLLGLTWNRNSDEFHFTVKSSENNAPITKRKVISEISRLYDPLGWVAPCIITSKVFIQKLWIAGIDWDDELPSELLREWKVYQTELSKLVDFKLPRWLKTKNNDIIIELHGFSDASNVAYSAVVYIRVIDCEHKIHSNLVTAKTKVAPIKQISLPRLELCGAVLLAKLLSEVAEVLSIPKVHAWTDSTVVLSWLNDHPSRWKTFIANRTSEILDRLDTSQWSHVSSKENPADCASRGITPTALLENSLWMNGPSWLLQRNIIYTKPKDIVTRLEERVVKVHVTGINANNYNDIVSRFSSLRKLIRVIAICRRFLKLKEPKGIRDLMTPYLSVSELQSSLFSCIRQSQLEHFNMEIQTLLRNEPLNKKGCLNSLNPFLDSCNILRIGGRLENSQLFEYGKHPIIISNNCYLAKLIVRDAHERTLHGGHQLTLNFIRTKYWILRAKNLLRSHIHNCVPCIRYAAKARTQLMGQLPSCRVTPSKPFLYSGVDYAGPINMRVSKGRGHRSFKGYICLFICMATRAIHIEAVSDLTSEGFLAAFKRFVSRRGHCCQLWSDNGSNFVGASKELRTLFLNEQSSMLKEVASTLANNGTEWRFIPPHAPNFGGVWEAGIKSTKHHLKRVIGDSTLTYEEMTTVLSHVEACLNSRPLFKASSDSGDEMPLTPGHFLVGQPLIVAPDNKYDLTPLSNLRRWQLTQKMVQCFWRRWSKEYLIQFFHRYKWANCTAGSKVGDIVLVMEDNLPSAKCCLAELQSCIPEKTVSLA